MPLGPSAFAGIESQNGPQPCSNILRFPYDTRIEERGCRAGKVSSGRVDDRPHKSAGQDGRLALTTA